MKLIVKTTSCDIWWGIYGLTGKSGWEDLHIGYENGEKLCTVCLNAKLYMKAALEEVKKYPEEAGFVAAIKGFLSDNNIHYWYYYMDRDDPDFYEVTYNAPENEKGIKPYFLNIWHPDEVIGVSTIKTAIQAFAMKFLAIEDCEVVFGRVMPLEEAVKELEAHYAFAGYSIPKRRKLNKKMLCAVAELWQMSEKEVLLKFKQLQKQK